MSSFLVPSHSLDGWFSKFQLNGMEHLYAAGMESKEAEIVE